MLATAFLLLIFRNRKKWNRKIVKWNVTFFGKRKMQEVRLHSFRDCSGGEVTEISIPNSSSNGTEIILFLN